MKKKIQKFIEQIESAPLTFLSWTIAFFSLIIIRVFIENWFYDFPSQQGIYFFYKLFHTVSFFLFSYLLIVHFVHKIARVSLIKSATILLVSYITILIPPIIDFIIFRGKGIWSFYKIDSLNGLFVRFFTFFGDRPDLGITYGVRVEVALAVIFLTFYAYIKTSRWIRALALGFSSYAIFFLLGTLPSWITIAIQGFSKGFLNVGEVDIAAMFLAPTNIFSWLPTDMMSILNIKMSLLFSLLITAALLIGLFIYEKTKLIDFIRNARFPQLIYHQGLLCVGMGLALAITHQPILLSFFNIMAFLVMSVAVACAWLASVVVNDMNDKVIDRETNSSRPLITNSMTEKEFVSTGVVLFILSISFSFIVSVKVSMLLLAYQALAWIYSAWPFRMKRLPFISTFISALASLAILFSGYILVSPDQGTKFLPASIVMLMLFGLTIGLPLKDFKDIAGDKKDGVYTIPVTFGEQWGRIIVACGLFASFIASVFALNELRLFWFALLFGAISFWIILLGKIDPRKIFWWILGAVSAYGLVLVKIVFF